MMSKRQTKGKEQAEKKTAVARRAHQEMNRSPAAQSGLSNGMNAAAQLSAADVQDLQQTYGNHFLQRLAGVSLDEGEEEETAMRAVDGSAGMDVSSGVESRIEQKRGGGQPLPGDFRAKMEGQFGADFENVRVHTDGDADALNQSLQAKAFTTGSDIFFRQGMYDTSSKEGQKLVAHELTHVVQQGGGQRKPVQPQLKVNPPNDQYEQEADATAEQVVENAEKTTAPPAATSPAPGSADAAGGGTPPPAKLAEGETAVSVSEPANMTPPPNFDKDHPVVKEAAEKAEQEAGKPDTTAPTPETAVAQSQQQLAQQQPQETGKEKESEEGETAVASPEEVKKEEKQSKKDEPAPQQAEQKEVPKIKKEDPSRIESMKYDPSKLEEPEMAEPLPRWDELAYGTIQTQSVEDVVAESRIRDWLIMGPSIVDVTDEALPENQTEETEETEESESVTDSSAEVNKFDLIKDALIGGVAEGVLEGATEFAVDQAMESFLTKGPGKKVPYADGLMSIAQIGMDPEGWAKGVKSAFGKEGFETMAKGWTNIGKEKTWAGYIAAFLEATIGTIDWINNMLGIVQQILQILIFVLIGIQSALAATLVGTSAIPVLTQIIAFLEKINNFLSAVGNMLTAIKNILLVPAILFRTIDIAIVDGDPDELLEKQEKLKGHFKALAKAKTQQYLNKKFQEKAGDQDPVNDAKKKRQEADTPDETPDPKIGKSRDELVAYQGEKSKPHTPDRSKSSADDDDFAALGVRKDADEREIRKAYLKRARETHPDKGGDAEEFKRVQNAYEKLKERKKQPETAPDTAAAGRTKESEPTEPVKQIEPADDKESKWSKVGKVIDDYIFLGGFANAKKKWGELKDAGAVFGDKEKLLTTDKKEWLGQRHGMGITGAANTTLNMLLSELSNGQVTSANDIVKNQLKKQIGIDLSGKNPEDFGASVLEFELSWSGKIDENWEWASGDDEPVALVEPANDTTKKHWKSRKFDKEEDKKVTSPKPKPGENIEHVVQPGEYTVSPPPETTITKDDKKEKASPNYTEFTMQVDRGSRKKKTLTFKAEDLEAVQKKEMPLQRAVQRAEVREEEPDTKETVPQPEGGKEGEEEEVGLPPDVLMGLLMSNLVMTEPNWGGEAAGAEAEEGLEMPTPVPFELQLYKEERTLEIIEALPEPPDSARRITAAAEAQRMMAAQEEIARMREQDIELRKEDARSQIIEMEKTKEITAVNQALLTDYQKEADQKLAAQETEKSVAKQAGDHASQAQSDAASSQGIMGALMAPLTKLLTGIITEFTSMDTSGAQDGAKKANSAMKEPGKGADTAVAGGDKGVAEAEERMMLTNRAKADAADTQKDLKTLDQTLDVRTQEATESINELEQAQEQVQEQRTEMTEGKENAQDEYEDALDEAISWAEEHRTMREAMFAELYQDLQDKMEGNA